MILYYTSGHFGDFSMGKELCLDDRTIHFSGEILFDFLGL
jgi:hypothetical protein